MYSFTRNSFSTSATSKLHEIRMPQHNVQLVSYYQEDPQGSYLKMLQLHYICFKQTKASLFTITFYNVSQFAFVLLSHSCLKSNLIS